MMPRHSSHSITWATWLVTPRSRSRLLCLLAIAIIIPLGLATRTVPSLPAVVRLHAGDTLWAVMVYCGFAMVLPRTPVWVLATLTSMFSLGIELSQLSEHPLLVEAREHRLCALVLGRGFLWIDLVRYAVGTIGAATWDVAFGLAKQAKRS